MTPLSRTHAVDDSSPAAVTAAAQKGLAFLEKEGAVWYEEKNCLSCHHTPFQVRAHREAQRRGLPVDQKKLDEWVGWCVERAEPKGGNDVLAELMVFLSRDMVPPGEAQKKLETLPTQIASFQKPDGSWAASGQFHAEGWPQTEANEATTRLMLQSLNLPWADAEITKANRERAVAWLKSRDAESSKGEPKSTRSYATRLAYAVHTNEPAEQTAALSEKLIALQKPDGGWSWKMDADGSDPITTGEVLYTLNSAKAKAKAMDTVTPRAVAYLLKAQSEDGSWYQDHKRISNKIRKEEKPKVDGIYSYWASAWATLGLLSTLPEVKAEVTVVE
ncbi:prenyltransferase/squalene oxidase repeat-containing protein [Roseimicrobium sp. ORNL1]|uniref:prenyltransferase/squalene oxidase repeat-containing protein n=1 Tax=Roseimicrobium sp. ORNL1 TaxID=2711231 RepID=UPI0013E11C83|nr:prenyltransferase/squalene oxidase repeat-containing protein [Roseimicrobium sp. ORNL1]QIF05581.1 terpene cyclase/mutase family protein [Roseimicrobium sp. ORNL1]